MVLTLDLGADIEWRLREAAARRGIDVNRMAADLIVASVPELPSPLLSPEEAEAILDQLAKEDGDMPVLPPEANSRAYYYEDHD